MIIYCFINAAPHFVFGPGEEALSLTLENGAIADNEVSQSLLDMRDKKLLCRVNGA